MKDLDRFSDSEPEDSEHELIRDSVLQMANTDFTQTDEFDELTPGKVRKNIIEDLGEKYSGKPVKRKTFAKKFNIQEESDGGSESPVDEDMEGDGSEDGEEEDESNASGSEFEGEEESGDEGDESEVLSESEIEDDEDQEPDSEGYNLVPEKGIDIYSARSTDVKKDIKRGQAVKNQLSIYEEFLKCRIKLQKGLSSANKLYQKEDFKQFKESLSPDGLTALSSTCENVKTLMGNLLELQVAMLKASDEYCQFRSKKTSSKEKEDADNESITSEESGGEKAGDDEPATKKKKPNKTSDILHEMMEEYRPFGNEVIQKWNDKTRLASGKVNTSGVSLSTLKQIEQIMCDKTRLIRRTQLKRSEYRVLKIGEKADGEEGMSNENEGKDGSEVVYDPEIYDDDDFYHKLLREFIERKSSDLTTPATLGKQWTELQKLRSKIKRKIDVRATKGRKLRYTVHNKLVGFMAPVPYCTWTEAAENELYRSLFGKAAVN